MSDKPTRVDETKRAYFTYVEAIMHPHWTQRGALRYGESAFRAMSEPGWPEDNGYPAHSTYSGLSIGDYCWSYRNSPTPGDDWNFKRIVLIQGTMLVRLTVRDNGIADAMR
jgi:hypothetical protein